MNETVKEIHLKIDGMNCGHCVRAVKEALSRVSGVTSAEVDLDTGHARVEHTGLATFESLAAEVAEEGYSASER
jgi:copper chaperone